MGPALVPEHPVSQYRCLMVERACSTGILRDSSPPAIGGLELCHKPQRCSCLQSLSALLASHLGQAPEVQLRCVAPPARMPLCSDGNAMLKLQFSPFLHLGFSSETSAKELGLALPCLYRGVEYICNLPHDPHIHLLPRQPAKEQR